MIKVSVLVPIYGTELYIERCARSLFEQTYDNIEIIFVNDCTKDNAIGVLQKIIENYPNRKEQAKIVNHEKNKGLAGARLTGLLHATGDYVWFVDSDDFVENNAIEICLPYLQQGVDMITFNYYTESIIGSQKYNEQKITIENILLNTVSPSIWKYIVRKDIFYRNNIYPVLGLDYSEDYLLTARLILVCHNVTVLVTKYLYHYELGNQQSYLHNPTVKSMENCIDTALMVTEFYKNNNVIDKYHFALALKMAFCFFDMLVCDRTNNKLKDILISIKNTDKLIYYIIRLFPTNCSKLILQMLKRLLFGRYLQYLSRT